MQVGSLNSSSNAPAAAAPAEDAGGRAEQFARALQTAFYGSGSVSEPSPNTAYRDSQHRRDEIRAPERNGNDYRRDDSQGRSDRAASPAAPQSDAAPRAEPDRPVLERDGCEPVRRQADRPTQTIKADKAADQPKTSDEPAAASSAGPAPKDQAAQGETAKQGGETAGEPAAGAEDKSKTAPAVAEAPDAALILALLQQADPAVAAAAVATAAAGAEQAADASAAQAAPVVGGQTVALPDQAAAAPGAAAQQAIDATAKAAVEAAGKTLPLGAAAAAANPAAGAKDAVADAAAAGQAKAAATETSAAALLAQQQNPKPADFQQAVAAQLQAVQDGSAKPQAKPTDKSGQDKAAVTAKTDATTEIAKGITITVTPAASPSAAPKSPAAPASQVAAAPPQDQPPLAQAQAQTQGQNQAPIQDQAQDQQLKAQQQLPAAEGKFAAALQAQGAADPGAAAGTTPAAAQLHSPPHLTQLSPLSNPGTPLPQAAQTVASQVAARNLGAYVPAGEQVAVQIKKGAAEGLDKISIKLDPGHLGKVEVKLEVGHDGHLTAVIAADKPETLHMLQREAQHLEQSLRDAGLKANSDSLNFSLRDQGQAGDGRGNFGAGANRRGRGPADYTELGPSMDTAASAARAQSAAARGGLDIRI